MLNALAYSAVLKHEVKELFIDIVPAFHSLRCVST